MTKMLLSSRSSSTKKPQAQQPVTKKPQAKQSMTKMLLSSSRSSAKKPQAQQPVAKQPAKQTAKQPAKQTPQQKLMRFEMEVVPHVVTHMRGLVDAMARGDLRKAVTDAVDKIGDAEHGLEGLKFMLSTLAHCTAVDVRVVDVVDRKGKIRIETKAAIKSLIESKLFDGEGAPLKHAHPDSVRLRTVLSVLFAISLGLATPLALAAAAAAGASVYAFTHSYVADRKYQQAMENYRQIDRKMSELAGPHQTIERVWVPLNQSKGSGFHATRETWDDGQAKSEYEELQERRSIFEQTAADSDPKRSHAWQSGFKALTMMFLAAGASTTMFYGMGGWAVHVQGIATDLRRCAEELVDAEELLTSIGTKPQDSPKQRRKIREKIRRECPGASMFAVLSPSGEPLTVGQMRAVQQPQGERGDIKLFELAYGGTTGCFENPRAGVVATVLGTPTRVLSALWGR